MERLVMGRRELKGWSDTGKTERKNERDFNTKIFQHSYKLIQHCVLHVQFTTHTHTHTHKHTSPETSGVYRDCLFG